MQETIPLSLYLRSERGNIPLCEWQRMINDHGHEVMPSYETDPERGLTLQRAPRAQAMGPSLQKAAGRLTCYRGYGQGRVHCTTAAGCVWSA